MADFWIKVEKGTPDKPEVLEMSAILGIDDPDTVMGKLIRVWSWFDSNSENGHAPIVTKLLLNRLTGTDKFVEAMVSVGWLVEKNDGFYMPNHGRHLGHSAKKRALDAERKRLSRNKPDNKKKITRPEKRRVDKIREERERKFSEAWEIYGKKGNRKTSRSRFMKLKISDIEKLFNHLPLYVESTPDPQFRKGFESYINNECWEDEIVAKLPVGQQTTGRKFQEFPS